MLSYPFILLLGLVHLADPLSGLGFLPWWAAAWADQPLSHLLTSLSPPWPSGSGCLPLEVCVCMCVCLKKSLLLRTPVRLN